MLIKITLILLVIYIVLRTAGRLYFRSLDCIDRLRFASKNFTKGESTFLYIFNITGIVTFIMTVITLIYSIIVYL